MRGGNSTGISPVQETSVPVINLGHADIGFQQTAQRIQLPAGPNPTFDITADIVPWDPTVIVPSWEAVVVGGALQNSKTDYTTYLPVGPNLGYKDNIQYATFYIQRKNVSLMQIEIAGTYAGMWIKLPGIQDQPLISNGWMDCFTNYVGYGIPGLESPGGCALGTPAFGGTQTLDVTFGPASSSDSTHNMILVRFQLLAGQKITGLRFSGVER
jgi:hypothetical protein